MTFPPLWFVNSLHSLIRGLYASYKQRHASINVCLIYMQKLFHLHFNINFPRKRRKILSQKVDIEMRCRRHEQLTENKPRQLNSFVKQENCSALQSRACGFFSGSHRKLNSNRGVEKLQLTLFICVYNIYIRITYNNFLIIFHFKKNHGTIFYALIVHYNDFLSIQHDNEMSFYRKITTFWCIVG